MNAHAITKLNNLQEQLQNGTITAQDAVSRLEYIKEILQES